MGLAGRQHHPPTESQYPFARLLAREAARPPCWAALHLHQMRRCAWLQGWPIGPATRFQQRIATATNELHAAWSRKLRPCPGGNEPACPLASALRLPHGLLLVNKPSCGLPFLSWGVCLECHESSAPGAPLFSPNLGVPRANLFGVLWRRWRKLAPQCIAPRIPNVSPQPGHRCLGPLLCDSLPGPTGWLPIGEPFKLCKDDR